MSKLQNSQDRFEKCVQQEFSDWQTSCNVPFRVNNETGQMFDNKINCRARTFDGNRNQRFTKENPSEGKNRIRQVRVSCDDSVASCLQPVTLELTNHP